MNCKPGDIAVIVYAPDDRYIGWLVEVLDIAPYGDIKLPDGVKVFNDRYGWWLIKSLGSRFMAENWDGSTYESWYASAKDEWLRPIRPGVMDDETQDNSELEGVK